MDAEFLLHGVVLLSGVVGAAGTGYLLYADDIVVHYRTFFRLVTAGLLLFAATAPVIVAFAPDLIHGVHALAALFVSAGLYTLLRGELEQNQEFERLEEGFELGGDGD